MPSCNDIVALALRQAGIIGLNAVPTASEADTGLTVLQGLYEGWAVGGMFGRLADVLTSTDREAKEGERIRVADGAAIALPDEIDGEGGPRAPRDLALVEIYDVDADVSTINLFDRDKWVELNDLELTDEAPMAKRGRDGLAACLAESYAEMFGGAIGPGVAARARAFRGGIIAKRGSTQDRQGSEADYY